MNRYQDESHGILRDSAIDELRHIVKNYDSMNEDFNQHYDIKQLVTLHRAMLASGWDFYPDRDWTARQIDEALRGIVPMWDSDERPIFPPEPRKRIRVL